MPRILIAGAGLSGLSLAHSLRKQLIAIGRKDFHITIVDPANRVGGWMKTDEQGGFICERGPHTISINSSDVGSGGAVYSLLKDIGLLNHVVAADRRSKNRYVYSHGYPRQIPNSALGVIGSKLLSGAVFEILKEPFQKKRKGVFSMLEPGDEHDPVSALRRDDESVASFIRRRLGKTILDRAVDPFLAGVYAGNPEKLSARSIFTRLYNDEAVAGSIVLSAFRRTKIPKRPPLYPPGFCPDVSTEDRPHFVAEDMLALHNLSRSALISIRGGLETLPRTLALSLTTTATHSLPVDLQLNTAVMRITPGAILPSPASLASVSPSSSSSTSNTTSSPLASAIVTAREPVTVEFKDLETGRYNTSKFDYVFTTTPTRSLSSIIQRSFNVVPPTIPSFFTPSATPIDISSKTKSNESTNNALSQVQPSSTTSLASSISSPLSIEPLASSTVDDLRDIRYASIWAVNVLYRKTKADRVEKLVVSGSRVIRVDHQEYPRGRGFGVLFPTSVTRDREVVPIHTNLPPGMESIDFERPRSPYLVGKHPLTGLLGIMYDSDIFPSEYGYEAYKQDPVNGDEYTAMTVMIGGDRFPDAINLSKQDVEVLAQDFLRFTLGIVAKPYAISAILAKDCLPQYELGHAARVLSVRQNINALYGRSITKTNSLSPSGFMTKSPSGATFSSSTSSSSFSSIIPQPSAQPHDISVSTGTIGWPRVTALSAGLDHPGIPSIIYNSAICAEQFVKDL